MTRLIASLQHTIKPMDKLVSIRGAITVNENSVKEIKVATKSLVGEIFKQNKLDQPGIINIIFTVTEDLDAINPATVTREQFKLDSTAMLCVQEMKMKNGLPKCIRVLINAYTNISKDKIKHVYLGNAESLRTDLGKSIS